MIKQFVPQEVCLKCPGCCRFAQENSVWAPCFLEEEIQDLLERRIPPASISLEKRIHPVAHPQKEGFVCPFLSIADNKCKIYSLRPFECRLYPFLITLRGKKIILTVDLNCPFAKENLQTKEFKEYTEYLSAFLNSPAQVRLLKDNPQVLQAYEEVLDVLELKV